MRIFCNPPFVLLVLALVILLVIAAPVVWRYFEAEGTPRDYDTSAWILVGLSIVAVVGIVLFVIFTFSHVGGLGALGC